MMDVTTVALAGAMSLVGLLLAAHFALKGWTGWLELKKMELASGQPRHDAVGKAGGGDMIEIADLKARIRKLEAIASGIDL